MPPDAPVMIAVLVGVVVIGDLLSSSVWFHTVIGNVVVEQPFSRLLLAVSCESDGNSIGTGSLTLRITRANRSNAYARTEQSAERLEIRESRESQPPKLGLESIVTKSS